MHNSKLIAVGMESRENAPTSCLSESSAAPSDFSTLTPLRSTLAETGAHIYRTTGREVFFRAVDVTDFTAVTAFVAAVDARFGFIDVGVTNSCGPPSNLCKATPPEAWHAAVELLC